MWLAKETLKPRMMTFRDQINISKGKVGPNNANRSCEVQLEQMLIRDDFLKIKKCQNSFNFIGLTENDFRCSFITQLQGITVLTEAKQHIMPQKP